jgi:hypothetical protein
VAEQWERRERHLVTVTGPAVADADDVIRELHAAMSDWRQIAAEPPNVGVPPGAVTLSAVGGVITVRVDHVESADVPDVEEPPEAGEGDQRG